MSRVSVSLDLEQLKLLRSIKGLGRKDAEILKNILILYLYENGYINTKNKKK